MSRNIFKRITVWRIVGRALFRTAFFFLFTFILTGCGEFTWEDLFTFKSVRTVRNDDVERLKKKADKYEKLLETEIESADRLGIIYQKLGEKYLDRKAWSLAIESFEKAIGYGQSSSLVHYSLGIAYANRGKDIMSKKDINKAEHHYKRALKITPDYYAARYGLGILLFYAKEDRGEGLRVMKRLVLENRNYYRARFALGRFYYELGKPHKSLSVYEIIYSDLQGSSESPQASENKEKCKENIERLMRELSGKR